MKNFKKIAIVSVVILVIVMLAGCGGDTDVGSSPTMVISNFYIAIQNQDYDTALECLTEECQSAYYDDFDSYYNYFMEDGVKPDVLGMDTADGHIGDMTLHVVENTEGQWRIDMITY